jgi:hypothetical protein
VENKTILKFADVRKVIGEHLKTALNIENFSITYARQEENDWNINVEYYEQQGPQPLQWGGTALFTIDGFTGDVKKFEKGRLWTT